MFTSHILPLFRGVHRRWQDFPQYTFALFICICALHKCRPSRLGINSRAQLATYSALHWWGPTGRNNELAAVYSLFQFVSKFSENWCPLKQPEKCISVWSNAERSDSRAQIIVPRLPVDLTLDPHCTNENLFTRFKTLSLGPSILAFICTLSPITHLSISIADTKPQLHSHPRTLATGTRAHTFASASPSPPGAR